MAPETKQEKEITGSGKAVSIDEAISLVGEYGRFQIIVNTIICFMSLPSVFQIVIMFFAADKSDWRCRQNSTRCRWNGSFSFDSSSPDKCSNEIAGEWEFVKPVRYSLVTQFNIHCKSEWVLEMVVSIFFVGWIIGSLVLGWASDHFGRKIVMFVSNGVIIITGFITPFLPNVYAIIVCRLIVGIFTPGTYQQGIMIMTESVGPRYRAFAGNIVFACVTTSMAICGLKAYFIRDWQMLHIVCSAPYVVILLFYKFVPESLRMLAVKGKSQELMLTLHRMAKFNKRELPSDLSVYINQTGESKEHNSSPLDLFMSKHLAKQTLCQILGYVVGGMTFYGLYIAAKDISGSLYRDYAIVTLSEIPFALCAIPLCDFFGRRKTTLSFYCVGTIACFGLCFAPEHGTARISRVLLGMLGKCSIGAGYNLLQTWTMELYPTYIRGEAMGFLQVLTRLGAALAPFADTELAKRNRFAPFIFFGCLTFVSMCFLPILRETKGEQMGEGEDGKKRIDSEMNVCDSVKGQTNELYNVFE